jgi:hypothetical protein
MSFGAALEPAGNGEKQRDRLVPLNALVTSNPTDAPDSENLLRTACTTRRAQCTEIGSIPSIPRTSKLELTSGLAVANVPNVIVRKRL